MITDDEIMRLFELADPTRDDDGARMVDASGYLDALQQRSYDMTLTEITEASIKSPRDNRWVLAAIVAAAIVLIVAGAVILTRDGAGEAPAEPPTTVSTVPPTTSTEQASGQSAEEAIALVRAYFDAANAYDAGLAMSFLAEGVIIDGQNWAPEQLRRGIEYAAAINEKISLGDCTPGEGQGPEITIRCESAYQGIRSDELGLGPFVDGSTDVVVADGKITSINSIMDFSENGFEEQVWDQFGEWLNAHHPDDGAVMFNAGERFTATEESIRLWEQRSREWVEARLAAEQVGTEFLEAFAAFDAEAAGAYLAAGASTEHVINQRAAGADYRQAIALSRAMGYEYELGACQQSGATATELQVRCPFAYHVLGSRELGLGPFDQNYFTVTVDDASAMITNVNSSWADGDFGREVGDPFATWVETTHPDELKLMTADGSPALTPESFALWEQLRLEYVQYVLGTTPTTTAA